MTKRDYINFSVIMIIALALIISISAHFKIDSRIVWVFISTFSYGFGYLKASYDRIQ